MHTLEILIEENTSGYVRPVEVVADAPIAALVPALVEELALPKTDIFGKKLVYLLRQSLGGRVIPEHMTLNASGILPGTVMTLDAYGADGKAATLERTAQPDTSSSLYSSETMSDAESFFGAPGINAAAGGPIAQKPRHKWSRRLFLTGACVVVGVAGSGVSYAAYRSVMDSAVKNVKGRTAVNVATGGQTAPNKAVMPTTAKTTMTFTRHQQTVRTLGWSSGGTLLASGGDDGHLLVWGTDGAVQKDITHPGAVQTLAWSPDGKQIVTGANNQVAFFTAMTGVPLARLNRPHMQAVTSVAWSAQGPQQVISAGLDKLAVVWDTKTYRPVTTYALHAAPIDAAAWAANGQDVATGSQGGFVRVWHAASGKDLHGYYQDAQLPMRAIAFAPTGMQMAVGGEDGMLRVWNNGLTCGDMGKRCMDMPQRLQVSQKAIRSLAWSPDGRFLLVGSDDNMFSLWAPGQSQTAIFKIGQNNIVHSVSWSPDSKQFGTATGTTVTLWTLI